jgi:hypothetical protein
MDAVCNTLAAIHGSEYNFAVYRWQGESELTVRAGRLRFCFVIEASVARVLLAPGQRIRGIPPNGPYQQIEGHFATVTAPVEEQLWPGDVICIHHDQPVTVLGNATCFQVETEATAYPSPSVAFLRHLSDHPGGCAAYPGAFRRETLPPMRATAGDLDHRGVNRLNEHTLDMRIDRDPRPQPHCHGPVPTGANTVVNHSETAIVLPRIIYDLPPVDEPVNGIEIGRVVLYRQALTDPTDTMVIPVRPGTFVVTPATTDGIAGHCFENAFAMLLAIPGFVSPHNAIR